MRGQFADALLATGRYREAVNTLNDVQRILAANGNARADYSLRVAEGYTYLNQPDSATAQLSRVLKEKNDLDGLMKQRLVRALTAAGKLTDAQTLFDGLPAAGTPLYQSSAMQSKGLVLEKGGNVPAAIAAFGESVKANPYNLASRKHLMNLYRQTDNQPELTALRTSLTRLDIKPGDAAGL